MKREIAFFSVLMIFIWSCQKETSLDEPHDISIDVQNIKTKYPAVLLNDDKDSSEKMMAMGIEPLKIKTVGEFEHFMKNFPSKIEINLQNGTQTTYTSSGITTSPLSIDSSTFTSKWEPDGTMTMSGTTLINFPVMTWAGGNYAVPITYTCAVHVDYLPSGVGTIIGVTNIAGFGGYSIGPGTSGVTRTFIYNQTSGFYIVHPPYVYGTVHWTGTLSTLVSYPGGATESASTVVTHNMGIGPYFGTPL
ncbi:MAG TPA: hypothetical protein VNQ55_00625 [Parapedobacter sp.]|nr:hypothetical protein [Parapedobacter sp.]